MFNQKAKMAEKIAGIRRQALEEIPKMLSATSEIIVEDYRQKRIELNMNMIQVLTGGQFEKNGDTWKVKFNQKLPNKSELAELTKIMETFIRQVEAPVLKAITAAGAKTDDDMSIPPRDTGFTGGSYGIPKIEKISSKKLKNYIFGGDGMEPLPKIMLSVADCMEIAVMGEKLRRKKYRDMMLIAGGIVLLLSGASVLAVRMQKRDGKVEDTLADLCDDTPLDMDDESFPSVDMTDEGDSDIRID